MLDKRRYSKMIREVLKEKKIKFYKNKILSPQLNHLEKNIIKTFKRILLLKKRIKILLPLLLKPPILKINH